MADKRNKWKALSSKIVHSNPWYVVREDKVIKPDGKTGKYYVVEKGFFVQIVPVTNRGEICLVGQFRYPTQVFSWELPAGKADKNESGLEAAKRELKEETGWEANRWQELSKLQEANGMMNSWFKVYIAQNLKQTDKNRQGEEGITEKKRVTFKQALKMVKRGEITDCDTVASLMLAGLYLGEI